MGNEQSTGHALGPIRVEPLRVFPSTRRAVPAEGASPTVEPPSATSEGLDAAGWEEAAEGGDEPPPAEPPWWAPLSASALSGETGVHRRAFDFGAFAAPFLPATAGAASDPSAAPSPTELAALLAATEEELQSCVREAQAAAESSAAAECAANTKQLESLEETRKALETELSAAKKEADRASGSGDAAAAETWRHRTRRLQGSLEANGAARSG